MHTTEWIPTGPQKLQHDIVHPRVHCKETGVGRLRTVAGGARGLRVGMPASARGMRPCAVVIPGDSVPRWHRLPSTCYDISHGATTCYMIYVVEGKDQTGVEGVPTPRIRVTPRLHKRGVVDEKKKNQNKTKTKTKTKQNKKPQTP